MTKRSVVAGLAIALLMSGVAAVAGAKPSKQRGEGKANRLVVTNQVNEAIPDAI